MPEGDTLHRTARGLAPHLVGRAVTAARVPPGGPQVQRIVGATIWAVEAVGKNLLIRFDNGLEVRTHLRMNGSWHRYRPGEAWRGPRAPARRPPGGRGAGAAARGAGTARAGGAGRGRGVLRRAGGRAIRATRRGAPSCAVRARAG